MISQEQTELTTFLFRLIFLIGISILIFVIQRLFQVYTTRFLVKSRRISLDMINNLKLIVRLVSVIIIFYLALVLFDFSLESIVGFSAVIGAIISFGSVQWISNFVAGVYLLLLRPFSMNDFIELNEEIRGTVEELSLNYTKIKNC